MRRALLGLAIGLGLTAGFAARAGDPAKAGEDAGAEIAAAWEVRLGEAQARLTTARERAAARDLAVTRARHRQQPRGEALERLEAAAADARAELAAAEAELPELLEQARREGVEAGVLRRFEADD